MYSIFDIVSYIIKQYTNKGVVEILCYYSKVFYRIIYDRDLFPEEFVAGLYGPVCNVFENRFCSAGLDNFDKRVLKDVVSLDDRTKEFIDCIMCIPKNIGEDELLASFSRDLPWILARTGLDRYDLNMPTLDVSDALSYYEMKLFSDERFSDIRLFYDNQRFMNKAPLRVFCIDNIAEEKITKTLGSGFYKIVLTVYNNHVDAAYLERCLSADIVLVSHNNISDDNTYFAVAKATQKKIIIVD